MNPAGANVLLLAQASSLVLDTSALKVRNRSLNRPPGFPTPAKIQLRTIKNEHGLILINPRSAVADQDDVGRVDINSDAGVGIDDLRYFNQG